MGLAWASMTFRVGRLTRVLRRKPSGFSSGSGSLGELKSVVASVCSCVESSKTRRSVTSSLCCRLESVAAHSGITGKTNPKRVQSFIGVVIHGVIFKQEGADLNADCWETFMGCEIDSHTSGIGSGGIRRFRSSVLSKGLHGRFSWHTTSRNSISRRLTALQFLVWLLMLENGPKPHAEQNLGSSIPNTGSK